MLTPSATTELSTMSNSDINRRMACLFTTADGEAEFLKQVERVVMGDAGISYVLRPWKNNSDESSSAQAVTNIDSLAELQTAAPSSLSGKRGDDASVAMLAAMTGLTAALLRSAPQGTRPRASSDLLSKADAVSYLRISPRTFERRVAPTLTAVRVGGRRFYKLTEIDSWLADQKVGGSSATLARGSTSCASPSMVSDGLDPQASAILARLRSKPRGFTPPLSPGASATAALPSPKSPSAKKVRRAGRPDGQ